jgi:CRP-like cAMP-binding protein
MQVQGGCVDECTPTKIRACLEQTVLRGLDYAALAHESRIQSFATSDGSIWKHASMEDRVLVVIHGRFRVVRRVSRSNAPQVLLRFAHAGAILGVSQLVEQPRTTDVFGAPRGGALVLSGGALRAQIATAPAVALALLREQRYVMEDLVDEIASLRTERFAVRVLRCIARFVHRACLVENRTQLDLCQREVAEMVGGSVPDVSKAIAAYLPRRVLRCRARRMYLDDVAEFHRILAMLDRPT